MKLSVFLNGSLVRDYVNPDYVGIVLYVERGCDKMYVCIGNEKIVLFDYPRNEDWDMAFNAHTRELYNTDYQEHHEWAKLTLWNDMYTHRLKWEVETSPYQDSTGDKIAKTIAKVIGFFTM